MRMTTVDGKATIIMHPMEVAAATEWARSFCHLALGPEKGETYFRKLPARPILRVWIFLGGLQSRDA